MDTERCKEFVVLAETKNFLEASGQLFIAQSSLSKHMKSLEKELGVTLLDRSTRHVELSAAGRVFLPYAKKLMWATFIAAGVGGAIAGAGGVVRLCGDFSRRACCRHRG